jgi:enhancer of mRNA-decapping protein 4
MKEIMIPAYEAATTQMFHQISKSVDQGLVQIATSQSQTKNASMEAMAMQMTKMAEAIQSLSSEVAQLKAGALAANNNTNNGAQPTVQQQPKPVDTRQEILKLCQSRRYEEAFTKAVSAANGDIVVFTCKHADITAAFNGEVTLSQTILICLMQQLGAVLVSATDPSDFKIIVTWLQEIAVTIDPTNESIKRRKFNIVVCVVLF